MEGDDERLRRVGWQQYERAVELRRIGAARRHLQRDLSLGLRELERPCAECYCVVRLLHERECGE